MNRPILILCVVLCFLPVAVFSITCDQGNRAPHEIITTQHLTFVKAGQYGSGATFQSTLGDLDGDADLDAAFSKMHSQSEVWLNDGSGKFTDSSQRLGENAHGIGIGDLD